MGNIIIRRLAAVIFFITGFLWLIFGGNAKILVFCQSILLGIVFLLDFSKPSQQKLAFLLLVVVNLLIFVDVFFHISQSVVDEGQPNKSMDVRAQMAQIQRATTKDVPALLPLIAEYWSFEAIPGFEPHRVAAQLTRLLSEPGFGAGWFAASEAVPVGYLLAVYVFSLEHLGLTAEIDEFYVVPSQRGRGVGDELLKAAEAEFVQKGCTNVSLQLSRNNGLARNFYHRHGYTERSGYELLDKMLYDG